MREDGGLNLSVIPIVKHHAPSRKALTEEMPSCIFRLREYMAVTSGYGHPFRLGTIKIQRS